MTIHKSVLLKEAVEALNIKKGDTIIDATLGGGGHTCEILKSIGKKGKLIAIDQDIKAVENFKKNLDSFSEVTNLVLIKDNFANLENILGGRGIKFADGVLADLGISSDQLEEEEKGISFQTDAKLDMRMDADNKLTAEEIINEWDQEKIENILRDYGEEKFAKNIVKKIIEQRKEKRIKTTYELVEIVKKSIPKKYQRIKTKHPATKTFQALRIAVNDELNCLKQFITSAIDSLRPGGRLVIISFHSLEDKIIKNIFRENARGCIYPSVGQLQILQKEYLKAVAYHSPSIGILEKALKGDMKVFLAYCDQMQKVKIITKKPIIPSAEEVWNNPRARSAKLRVCEKI